MRPFCRKHPNLAYTNYNRSGFKTFMGENDIESACRYVHSNDAHIRGSYIAQNHHFAILTRQIDLFKPSIYGALRFGNPGGRLLHLNSS